MTPLVPPRNGAAGAFEDAATQCADAVAASPSSKEDEEDDSTAEEEATAIFAAVDSAAAAAAAGREGGRGFGSSLTLTNSLTPERKSSF